MFRVSFSFSFFLQPWFKVIEIVYWKIEIVFMWKIDRYRYGYVGCVTDGKSYLCFRDEASGIILKRSCHLSGPRPPPAPPLFKLPAVVPFPNNKAAANTSNFNICVKCGGAYAPKPQFSGDQKLKNFISNWKKNIVSSHLKNMRNLEFNIETSIKLICLISW